MIWMAQPDREEALAQVQRVFVEISAGVDLCLAQDLKTAALILLYSGIDIAGWMADQSKAIVQERFTAWVDAYARPFASQREHAVIACAGRGCRHEDSRRPLP